ncbi:MAG TPA: hypothetical protein VGQ42_16170 [Candidatus Dormibacteraeota bacterium]|jgi:hypothetical protein|nr:hypothetical protein [Candidatus Dormibacteraeota bacterium]
MSKRPADECPYPRPFPTGFHDCPAYRSQLLLPLDSRYRPLAPERTCQHLQVGNGSAAGRFYGRCAVGTAEDRRRWADPERERLLAEIEALQEAMQARVGQLTQEMITAKGVQLAAFSSLGQGTGVEAATAEVQRIARLYTVEIEALFEEQADRLQRLNLPIDTLMELFRVVFERWVPQRSMETPVIPDELVERFPEQAWWLLRPRSPAR